MTTREAVLRALGKKAPFQELNYELVDQTDVMDIINREREDVELLEQTLKDGREKTATGGGLTLRQGTEMSRFPNSAGSSGFRRDLTDSSLTVTHKPRLMYAVFLISSMTLVATALFTLCDSITVVEIAYKVHALAGVKRQNREPLRDERVMRWRGTGFLQDEKQENAAREISEASVDDLSKLRSKPSTKTSIPLPVNPVTASDTESLPRRQSSDPGCQEHSTTRAQIFGLSTPEMDDVIRMTTGVTHTLDLVSFDSFGQRRCGGGDYYETDLRSQMWKSRPPVHDLHNGTYQVELNVDPRFAGKFIFEVTLLLSNFDGLKQLDPTLSDHEYKKFIHEKVVASLDIEFVLPRKSAQTPNRKAPDPQKLELPGDVARDVEGYSATAPSLELKTCKGEDFKPRQWSGRWTRGAFNPNCSIDSKDNRRFNCLDPETKCEHPWCAGDVGRLDSNGWVYSAHCSFKIFSPDEAWQCLDGQWLFWWSDSDDQENALVRDLLKSVLGLSLPEGRWDGMGRFSNKVFIRPDGSETVDDQHITTASLRARNLKQQVRMTNMWNSNLLSNPDYFQGVISSYFSKFSSPDIVIMNSGLHEGARWHNWTEFVNVGVQNATNCWKEILTSILPSRHAHVVFTTTGAQWLSDFNPQLMEMYTTFILNAYATANLTSDFKIVDGFDHSFSWMGRYKGDQHFVDLMNVHMLLNAICTVD